MECTSFLRLSSCMILAIKCSGASVPFAISLIPTREPSFDFWATKIIALIPYSHVFENIISIFSLRMVDLQDKGNRLFYIKRAFSLYLSNHFKNLLTARYSLFLRLRLRLRLSLSLSLLN